MNMFKKWYPRQELNLDQRGRSSLLYPFKLRGHYDLKNDINLTLKLNLVNTFVLKNWSE